MKAPNRLKWEVFESKPVEVIYGTCQLYRTFLLLHLLVMVSRFTAPPTYLQPTAETAPPVKSDRSLRLFGFGFQHPDQADAFLALRSECQIALKN